MNRTEASELSKLTPAPNDQQIPWTRLDSWIIVGFLLFALVVVGLHNDAYATLSPIDELQHIDHALKSSKFEAINNNERVGQEAMLEAACRGVDSPGYVSPPCDSSLTYNPDSFQERGVNTSSDGNPPYYFVSGVFGRIVAAITPLDSVVGGIRLSGALWMASAFGVMWLFFAELGIPRGPRAAALGLVSATPQLVFTYSTVNADNAILLTATLAFWATLRFERRLMPWWGLAAICAGAIYVEITNVLAVLAVGTYLVLRSATREHRSWSQFAMGAVLGIGAVPCVFILARIHQVLIPSFGPLDFELPRNIAFDTDSSIITGDLLLQRLGTLVTPISTPYIPSILFGEVTQTTLQFASWILIGGAFAGIVTPPSKSRVGVLSLAVVSWLLLAGPLLQLRWSNTLLVVPARYGLPLLPVLLLGVAYSVQKRTALVGVAAIAAYTNLYILYRLVIA